MKFTVVTILPELVEPSLSAGVVGRAREAGTIAVTTANPRDFTHDKHRTVDDSPYGGGPGMVMKPEPLLAAIDKAGAGHRILLSPSGRPLTQARVRELAAVPHLVLVCGRYEGIDQRVIDLGIDEELSLGDYVLSGGELGALVIIDAVARYIPGVLGAAESTDEESFSAGLLEYPHYTRPAVLRTALAPLRLDPPILAPASIATTPIDTPADHTDASLAEPPIAKPADHVDVPVAEPPIAEHAEHAYGVPAVLSSGNHALIAQWRRQQSLARTALRRPDLYKRLRPTAADVKLWPPLGARTHLALVHHPVVDRTGAVITTALTNFDIHDLARSSMTYGLAAFHIITPITSQRDKAEHISAIWSADEQGEHRSRALGLVRTSPSIEDTIAAITADAGRPPMVVATSAKAESFPGAARRTPDQLLAEASADPAPLLILLGSGWGLADSLIPSVSRVLAPIEGASAWNHLAVRSAGAVILDRLFGRVP